VRSRWLQAALSELNPRERQIVVQRKLRDDRITLEEIGVTLGITKERVRQIEHKALAKLRQAVLKLSGEAR
jgi:RNA polymerase sigma-32 factor